MDAADNNIIPATAQDNNNINEALPAAAMNYRPLADSLADEIISRRSFGSLRYLNRDALRTDISVDISDFIHNDGMVLAYRFLNTLNNEVRVTELAQAVKPLQRAIGEKLCVLLPCFHGQDDGLFDMTTTEQYKAIQWDLVDFMLSFIGSCAAQLAEDW
jgi:hypothetical protein